MHAPHRSPGTAPQVSGFARLTATRLTATRLTATRLTATRLTANSTRAAAIRGRSRLAVALSALAVALTPLLQAHAGPAAGTNMLTTASNAKLPTARGNFGVGPAIAAQDYGADGSGASDASSALSTACTAAATAGAPLGLSGIYKVSSNLTLACDLAFAPGSVLKADSGKTVTVNGRILASDVAYIFQGAGSVVAATAPSVSVQWWGAGHGIADDATAFRAALGSDRVIHVPPAAYVFNSTQSIPANEAALPPIGVLIDGESNWEMAAYGATLEMGSSVAAATTIQVHASNNWTISGLNCLGNRGGLTSGQGSSCLVVFNDVGFAVRDLTLSGNWGGDGTGVYGDWLVNGVFSNFYMPKVNICLGFGFIKNVRVDHGFAEGADNNGNQGSGQMGDRCIGESYDVLNSTYNATGYSFTDTDGYSVTGVDASNFSVGWTVQSGNHYYFSGNYWHANPGAAGVGAGGYIAYNNGGNFSSVGHPPGNITVVGDSYVDNGTAGYGIDIANGPDSADTIANILVADSVFDNNATTGIEAAAASLLANIRATRNVFSGASQTTGIGPHLIAVGAAGNVLNAQPANPTGTTNSSGLMMGLAGSFTPQSTGTVAVTIAGDCYNTTAGDGGNIKIRYGTGTAPSNGGALVGTAVGNLPSFVSATASQKVGCAASAVITGLTIGTPYWLDLKLGAATGGTAAIENVSITAVEIGS